MIIKNEIKIFRGIRKKRKSIEGNLEKQQYGEVESQVQGYVAERGCAPGLFFFLTFSFYRKNSRILAIQFYFFLVKINLDIHIYI